jgi:hypothetical protein
MRTTIPAAFAFAALAATTAGAGIFSDCDKTAPRSVAAPLAGVTKIVIVGAAGTLKVEGQAGVGEVRATGSACASSDSLLRDITLTATRTGSELRIEAETPDNLFMESATLDFSVVVPNNVPLRVEDGSGSLQITGTAAVDVTDGSGELTVKNVNGNVMIHDGSGSIDVADVSGDVRVTDGSGSIDILRAGGVLIDADGSGSVDISTIKHNVEIGSKGSGSVNVADVGGDFRVSRKGSGHIDYERVAGKVAVPARN